MKIISFVLILIYLFGLSNVHAALKPEIASTSDRSAGIAKAAIPIDPTWVRGVLPNGLRYAVRSNKQPQKTISIRVHVAAGGLMEKDIEQGWAHLLEHMLFRGTKNYPDGEAIKTWQRLGASFGQDTNAQTSLTSTSYILDLPKRDKTSYDQALSILSGMMQDANIDPELLKTERNIVLSERAARQPPLLKKVRAASEKVLLTGLRAAHRDIGGTDETLSGATAKGLTTFYQRWYRPSRTTIIVSGDADEKMLVEGIKKAFGDWHNTTNAPNEPNYGQVKAPENPVAIVTDSQAPHALQLAWMHEHDNAPFTKGKQEQQFLNSLAVAIINQRIATVAQKDNTIVNAAAGWNEARNVADQLTISISPKAGDWKTALNEVFSVINALKATPPSQAEIDQHVAAILQNLKKSVESLPTASSSRMANGYMRNVDQGDVTAERAYYLELFTAQIPSLTPQKLIAAIQHLLAPEPRMILLSPTLIEGGNVVGREALQLAQRVKAAETKALRKVSLAQLQISEIPGNIVGESKIEDLGIERIFFENGLELAVKQTDFKKGDVKISVMIDGGVLAQPKNDPGLFWTASGLGASGLGPFTPDEMVRLLAGRQLSFFFAPEAGYLTLTGNTKQADTNDMLRLMVTAVTQMRYDPVVVSRLKDQLESNYPTFYASPTGVFQAFAPPFLHGGDQRFQGLPPLDVIQSLNVKQFQEFWQNQLMSGAIKVVVVGDFDREKVVKTVAETFGGLPSRSVSSSDDRLTVRPSKPVNSPVTLRHKGAQDQAMVTIVFPTQGSLESLSQDDALDIAASILAIRLNEVFRQRDGNSYAPFASSNQSPDLPSYGTIVAGTQLKRENIGEFRKTLAKIIHGLATHGPSEDILKRAVEIRNKDIAANRLTNHFWAAALKGDLDDVRWLEQTRIAGTDRSFVDIKAVQEIFQKYLVTGNNSFEIHVLGDDLDSD